MDPHFNVRLMLKCRNVEPVSVRAKRVSADEIQILKIRDQRLRAKIG